MIERYMIFNNPYETLVLPTVNYNKNGKWVKYEDVIILEEKNKAMMDLLKRLEYDCKDVHLLCPICKHQNQHTENCELKQMIGE